MMTRAILPAVCALALAGAAHAYTAYSNCDRWNPNLCEAPHSNFYQPVIHMVYIDAMVSHDLTFSMFV